MNTTIKDSDIPQIGEQRPVTIGDVFRSLVSSIPIPQVNSWGYSKIPSDPISALSWAESRYGAGTDAALDLMARIIQKNSESDYFKDRAENLVGTDRYAVLLERDVA